MQPAAMGRSWRGTAAAQSPGKVGVLDTFTFTGRGLALDGLIEGSRTCPSRAREMSRAMPCATPARSLPVRVRLMFGYGIAKAGPLGVALPIGACAAAP